MRVVYLDVYFFLNLWMNLLLMAVTSAISRERPAFWRMLLAAGLGAVFSCIAIFCSRYLQLPGLLLMAFFMNWICFSHLPFLKLLCRTFIYLAAAVVFGGLINWWYFEAAGHIYVSAGGMAVFSGMAAAVLLVIFWWRRRVQLRERNVYQVLLSVLGHDIVTKGFLDSGNLLTDALGRPVHILEAAFLYEQCPEVRQIMLNGQEGGGSFELDYKSLGGEGRILVMTGSRLMIPELGQDIKNPLIGLAERPLFADNRCHMLLHGTLKPPYT